MINKVLLIFIITTNCSLIFSGRLRRKPAGRVEYHNGTASAHVGEGVYETSDLAMVSEHWQQHLC